MRLLLLPAGRQLGHRRGGGGLKKNGAADRRGCRDLHVVGARAGVLGRGMWHGVEALIASGFAARSIAGVGAWDYGLCD